VTAFDAVTGSVDWFTHLPSGVSLAPAVAGDIVMAATMSDSIYGLDRDRTEALIAFANRPQVLR
jgi:hypothetical protein